MYVALLLLVACQRLAELQIANSNVAYLKRLGAVEHGARHYPLMVALHTFWLVACYLEWRGSEPVGFLVLLLGWGLLLAGQVLRWQTIRTLGRRWTTRVLVLPDAPLVTGGPFRYFRHPNYVGVVMEIFGLPLIGGCWKTALVFGGLNVALLKHRIALEDKALRGWGKETK